MGYVIVTAGCVCCSRIFGFNPHKVPSIRIKGKRQAICRPCVEAANNEREKSGLDPFPILPGAYGPMDEGEL